jgi:N-acetylmuramoyl-L-alanine amidase
MIAICVGHSRPGDSGAVSVGGISERTYNGQLAKIIRAQLEAADHECEVIDAYQGGTYGTAMRWLGRKLATIRATVAVELHFNFGAEEIEGHEWLYWRDSNAGRLLARALERNMIMEFPAAKRRGIHGLTPKEPGAEFVRATPCPAVICEPFFGSNAREWREANQYRTELAAVIARGLTDWIGGAQ